MKNFTSWSVYAFIALFFSCTYDLVEPEVVEIEIGEVSPKLIIDSETDTIFLYETKQFRIGIDLVKNTELLEMTVYINDKVVKKVGTNGLFSLSPADYPDGYNDLKIKIIHTTGSESLASKLDAEAVISEFHYIVVIDKIPPPALELNHEIVDGTLKLYWSSPEKRNFNYLELVKENKYFTQSVKITNLNTTSFIDSSYLSGNITYKIRMISGTFAKTSSHNVNYKVAEGFTVKKTDDILTFQWSPPVFYNNVKSMKLRFNYNNINDIFIDDPLTVTEKTTPYVVELGQPLEVRLIFLGKESPFQINSIASLSQYYYHGEKMPPFESIKYNEALNSYFIIHDNNLHRLDDTMEIIATYNSSSANNYSLSPRGSYLYIVGQGNHLIKLDPVTLEIMGNIDLADYFQYPLDNPILHFNVADDNSVAFDSGKRTYVVDLDDKAYKIFYGLKTYYSGFVSTDRKYFAKRSYYYYWDWNKSEYVTLQDNGLFAISGDDINKIYDISGGYFSKRDHAFINNENVFVLRTSANVLEFYNILAGQVIGTYPISFQSHFSYDNKRDQIIIATRSNNKILMECIDYNTAEIVKTYSLPVNTVMIGDYAFAYNGYYAPLNSLN